MRIGKWFVQPQDIDSDVKWYVLIISFINSMYFDICTYISGSFMLRQVAPVSTSIYYFFFYERPVVALLSVHTFLYLARPPLLVGKRLCPPNNRCMIVTNNTRILEWIVGLEDILVLSD